MKRLLFLLFISISFSAGIKADELSLAELMDIALQNNPETEKAWGNVKRAQAVVGITKAKEYPHLNAQGSVTRAREVKFPNGPDTTFISYGGELNLNYLLCDFGENRAAIHAAKEALSAAKWWADFAMQKIMASVAANYYELLNARELLETTESSLNDAELILEAAAELRKAGLRSENDQITAKAAVAEFLMAIAQKKAAAAIAYGKLLTAMGISVETPLSVQTKPEGIQNPLFQESISALLAVAQEQRADLMARRASLADMNARVDRAKRAPLPKVYVNGQGGWLEYGKHEGNGYNYSAGVAVDVPIFKGFEYTYQKKHAMADVEISAGELRELQQAVALEVLTYSETVKAASEAMKYSEEFFAEALKSYQNSLESYKTGLINIFDLLQTQKYLSEARNKRALARTAWLVSLSQLAFATGSMTK
jgi:outer membrane protein TolC